MFLIFPSIQIFHEEFVPNILSPSTLISLKILSGEEYFETSNHKSPAIFGKTKIESTITHNQISAYLIELIAGLILSSFHPDKISKIHPQRIYKIENIPAKSTMSEMANKRKSPISIFDVNKTLLVCAPFVDIASAVSKNITIKLKSNIEIIY